MRRHCLNHVNFSISAKFIILFIGTFLYLKGLSQCFDEKINERIDALELNASLSNIQKANAFYILKRKADSCKLTKDSICVKILENIALCELQLKNYSASLYHALKALSLNTSNKQKFSKILLVKNYSILARYYYQTSLFNKALAYYDTTIATANFPAAVKYVLDARLFKAYIHFLTGDFQKGVEESTIGLNLALLAKDSIYYLRLSNQRIQSLFYQNKLQDADNDINTAIQLAERLSQTFQLASAYKMKALIAAKRRNFLLAEKFFVRLIKERTFTKRYDVVAVDYNDFGNFYRDSTHDYTKAKNCYLKAVTYALKKQDSAYLGMIYINLTKTYFYENKYKEAEQCYIKQMKYLKLSSADNFLINPAAKTINLIGNKHVIIAMLQDKTELLLNEYKKNGLKQYLSATVETARLTDSVITQTQHEQIGEQSKLFWRDKTREFYRNSIEACYLTNEPDLAFFFFEKSRAVLLNDQLNQLDVISRLPVDEAESLEKFQVNVIEQEQKLSLLNQSSAAYEAQQIKFLQARENFENYRKSLEQKYPAYYQYKYEDKVPSLNDLQKYLAKNKQSFVHYFLGDTVTYILAVTATGTTFKRLSTKEFDKEKLTQFLKFCASKQALNNNYDAFVQLSHSIYTSIFQQLHLPAGRIIICADNIVIPFDALYTDAAGKRFLLNDYTFSYVYSARFLMKQFKSTTAKGIFAGFAPVSFDLSLKVADLKNAAKALDASAAYYKTDKLFTHKNASRRNFFEYAPSYSVISILSHARADTTDNEPVLFMQDSVIHLSELQLLNHPATKLALLSACQTNVGKAATGEGIFSLARGFATAGIPSVAATLWKADEQTIYAISEKFNQLLSEGMSKDEALQKAKLYFIDNNSSEKAFPYYWANMILIGNTDAIDLTTANNNYWWIAGVSFIIITVLFFVFRIRSSQKKS